MQQPPSTYRSDLANIGRGMLMGGADVIPGVSGGTMALILGIYPRLVTNISRFDRQFVRMVATGRLLEAARHVELRFLVTLGTGIGLGILTLGGLMNHLLTTPTTRSVTLATFFGMILASSLIVVRMVRPRYTGHGWRLGGLGLTGVLAGYLLTGLPLLDSVQVTPLYVLVCGAIAICAMILPGISGAYFLLILGLYVPLTDILKSWAHGRVAGGDLITVLFFGCGCAIGLLSFSKFLRFLLEHFKSDTLAVLCGLMLGALRRIWPFQIDTTPDVEEWSQKIFRNTLPASFDREVVLCITAMVVAAGAILLLEYLASRLDRRL